jgi:hypothetical protein
MKGVLFVNMHFIMQQKQLHNLRIQLHSSLIIVAFKKMQK